MGEGAAEGKAFGTSVGTLDGEQVEWEIGAVVGAPDVVVAYDGKRVGITLGVSVGDEVVIGDVILERLADSDVVGTTEGIEDGVQLGTAVDADGQEVGVVDGSSDGRAVGIELGAELGT
jgi:hypothetical protein